MSMQIATAPTLPVQIGCDEAPPSHREWLLNLSCTMPPIYSSCQHLVELVFAHPDAKNLARQRYRHYRDQGHTMCLLRH